jgi:hypothetical protein
LSEAEAVEQPKKFVLKGLAHAEDVAGSLDCRKKVLEFLTKGWRGSRGVLDSI